MSEDTGTIDTGAETGTSTETSSEGNQSNAPESTQGKDTASVAGTTSAAGDTAEPAPYTPNFKYKVYGEEKELPEYIRGIVKSQEDEKKVRELFEMSEAVPGYKKKLEDAHNKYSTFEGTVREKLVPELQHYHSLSESLRSSVEKQDFQGVCESLGINPDALLGIAAKEAALRQNPAQYQLAQAERERMRVSQTAERSLSTKEQQAISIEARYIDRMLGMVFDRTDVKQYKADFDARMGKPGAFEDEVRQRGDYLYQRKQEADPVKIVEYLMKSFPVGAASTSTGTAAAQPPAAASGGKPPTIPSVRGGTSSPTSSSKKKPGSIKEMKEAWEKEHNGG